MRGWLVGWLAVVAVVAPMVAWSKPAKVKIDYYGTPLELRCEVSPKRQGPESVEGLVKRDFAEVGPCHQALAQLAREKMGIVGYAELLLLAKFVETLPRAKNPTRHLTSFAQAVLDNQPIDETDRAALLYALISHAGYGAKLMRSGQTYFLTVRVEREITGTWWGQKNQYAWTPGAPLAEPGPPGGYANAEEVLINPGAPLEFIFPKLAWEKTGAAEAKTFETPPGCPETWRVTAQRRPELERYLALWPRDREVLASNAERILAPYGFAAVLKERAPELNHQEFGSCLLRYVMVNLPYVCARDPSRPDPEFTRNPAETIFAGGDCDELSYVLVGFLRMAGFPADHIKVLRWKAGSPESHMNLGVLPLTGDGTGSHVEYQGKKFFIMDPAYSYSYNGELATTWGLLSDEYQGGAAEINDLEGSR